MKQKKKIVFFDSWSVGTAFTTPLAISLCDKFELYHVNWDSQMKKSSSRIKNTIENFVKSNSEQLNIYNKIVDCSDYSNSVVKVLNLIKPDLIITIFLHSFEHRYFNQIASQLGIPSIMYMHGLRGMKVMPLKIKSIKTITEKAKRLRYYTNLYINFLLDIRRMGNKIAPIQALGRYYKLTFQHFEYTNNPKTDMGLNYKKVFVTFLGDINYFKSHYGLNTSFNVIGHIDAHKLIDELYTKDTKEDIGKRLLFISQPLVRDGIINSIDFERSVKLGIELADKLGLKFALRPHPKDDFSYIKDLAQNFKFEITKEDLSTDLINTQVICGFNSTVLFTSQVINKTLVLFDISSYPLHPALRDYKNSFIVNDLIEPSNDLVAQISQRIINYKAPSVNELQEQDPIVKLNAAIEEILC